LFLKTSVALLPHIMKFPRAPVHESSIRLSLWHKPDGKRRSPMASLMCGMMKRAKPSASNGRFRRPWLLALGAQFIACAIILQALGGAIPRPGHDGVTDQRAGVLSAVADEICSFNSEGDSQSPHHSRHNYCAYCPHGDRDETFAAIIRQLYALAETSLDPEIAQNSRTVATIAWTQAGWGTSWSSRAPPALS
jgi:hypothetical protein